MIDDHLPYALTVTVERDAVDARAFALVGLEYHMRVSGVVVYHAAPADHGAGAGAPQPDAPLHHGSGGDVHLPAVGQDEHVVAREGLEVVGAGAEAEELLLLVAGVTVLLCLGGRRVVDALREEVQDILLQFPVDHQRKVLIGAVGAYLDRAAPHLLHAEYGQFFGR